MAAPFRAILSKSVFSKYLDRLHGKKLLADDKILIKKKNTVKEKNRAEGKWARASSDERRTMQDWTLQVDYRLKGPLLLKLPDTGLQEAIRSSDHPLKIPPYGRLSINWSGKSNCAFVFASPFFQMHPCRDHLQCSERTRRSKIDDLFRSWSGQGRGRSLLLG